MRQKHSWRTSQTSSAAMSSWFHAECGRSWNRPDHLPNTGADMPKVLLTLSFLPQIVQSLSSFGSGGACFVAFTQSCLQCPRTSRPIHLHYIPFPFDCQQIQRYFSLLPAKNTAISSDFFRQSAKFRNVFRKAPSFLHGFSQKILKFSSKSVIIKLQHTQHSAKDSHQHP